MEIVRSGNVASGRDDGRGHVRRLAAAISTFASNVVERVHEHADARLSEELTIVEQRRRLLQRSLSAPGTGDRFVAGHPAHVDG